jgi:trehalose 6-phosphate synthase/phosphatase
MPQVIIVSNRLPISVKKENNKLTYSTSLGGVATGLSSYVTNKSGNLWIGWPGINSDDLTSKDKIAITKHLTKKGYVPVFLSKNQVDNFYNGYSNSVLWPYFHNLPFGAADTATARKWWQTYKTVNQLFEETISENAAQDSQIWVHDFHLLLLPQLIRKTLKDASIGFFLHIPFPAYRQFNRLKQADKLLEGVLGSDLIGFHTFGYVENFLDSTSKILNTNMIDSHRLNYKGRTIQVGEFPMGIDYAKFAEASKLKNVKKLVSINKQKYKGLKVIASVDRLDPSKGLVERLKAYREFLETYPKKQGKVTFVMVAAPSRTDIAEYQQLSKRLDKLSAEINEQFSTDKWQALEYINQPQPFESVTALFQIADVAFITPIKDGMNLAAKEFIASNKTGVLILSQTAGAAEELKEALLVDPKNTEDMVGALNRAINMRRTELKRRLRLMRRHLSTNTVQHWAKSFVDSLSQPLPGTPAITRVLNDKLSDQLVNKYKSSQKRLLFFDYDGTLIPFSRDYSKTIPSDDLIKLLKKLSKNKANEIVLISGRQKKQLDEWFGGLNISLVAEHGAWVKRKSRWQELDKSKADWQKRVLPILQKYADLTPGASLEIKERSIVWHYRGASSYYSQKNLVAIRRLLDPLLKKYDLNLMQGNKIVEVKEANINKGMAAQKWLDSDTDYDFILALGDDVTDEELFDVLPFNAASIKVGRSLTKAHFRLANSKEILKFLQRL